MDIDFGFWIENLGLSIENWLGLQKRSSNQKQEAIKYKEKYLKVMIETNEYIQIYGESSSLSS